MNDARQQAETLLDPWRDALLEDPRTQLPTLTGGSAELSASCVACTGESEEN